MALQLLDDVDAARLLQEVRILVGDAFGLRLGLPDLCGIRTAVPGFVYSSASHSLAYVPGHGSLAQ
jgi:hypothetical protein